jgi:hypothetical protein
MNTKDETGNPKYQWEFTYGIPSRWVTYITYAMAGTITSVVAAAITAVAIVLVLLGGLWVAYAYLPVHVFYIILAVLVADMLLGIVLRAVLSRR